MAAQAASGSAILRSRRPGQPTLTVEALLSRYPYVTEQELATLLRLFPTLPILDTALLTADDRLSGRLDAFWRDHGGKLSPRKSTAVYLLLLALVALGIIWWSPGAF